MLPEFMDLTCVAVLIVCEAYVYLQFARSSPVHILYHGLVHWSSPWVRSINYTLPKKPAIRYDKESDKLVGFVLIRNNEGVPLTDSFIATSFDFVEQAFMSTEIGKYVLVYMAQPLEEHVQEFCLMCTATNNKYNAEFIVKRWKYIYDECSTGGIHIISFGADGDSKQLQSFITTTSAPLIKIPEKWKSWFLLYNPTAVAYVQDTIHLAVKLKARLLKISIILPLGKYVAGLHHL